MINEDGVEIEHGMVVYEPWKGGYYRKSEADEVIAHNKYKRCLAMANWCDDAARLATWDKDYHRCGWYNKWMRRWLELAEKFKREYENELG